ncbi:hypothetical protein ACIQCF_37985 [Streptomyces sp. NPDC088353]|uniref:hypothetical protein n=1 Tax=Streptomyces sp. NPDC088353 TaxID=3365855 RepID=UPI00382D8D5C
MRCQVCAQPARTRHGVIFLTGPNEGRHEDAVVRTDQPPVCPTHTGRGPAVPRLAERPPECLARSAPLYGVISTPCQ